MHCSEFLYRTPHNKKGYYLYGDSAIVEYILYDQFPLARKVASYEQLVSSAPGQVIIEPSWAADGLNYVGLQQSDRVYVFISEGGDSTWHQEINKEFVKLKLPRVDCSDPTTPKTQQVTVEYIQHRTKLVEPLARKFAVAMHWDMSLILNSLCLWAPITGMCTLPEAKALKLIEVLAPKAPLNEFLDNLFQGTFHRIQDFDYAHLDPVETLQEFSDRLNKLRILMEVYTNQKNVSTLVKESGLTTAELKYYIPMLKKWNKSRVKYWSNVVVWAQPRVDNPGALPAMVSLLARK